MPYGLNISINSNPDKKQPYHPLVGTPIQAQHSYSGFRQSPQVPNPSMMNTPVFGANQSLLGSLLSGTFGQNPIYVTPPGQTVLGNSVQSVLNNSPLYKNLNDLSERIQKPYFWLPILAVIVALGLLFLGASSIMKQEIMSSTIKAKI